MKKPLDLFLFFLAIFLIFLIGQYFYFYSGFYWPLPPAKPSLEEINFPATEIKTFPEIFEKREGFVLIDFAHNNNFQPAEISLLTFRITARGFDFEYLKEKENLETKLSQADAFLVILPQEEFTEKENNLIKEFKEKGGKILLIADPTRSSKINSLASNFGIIFESDYLYNQKENDGNFRYIFIKDFKSNDLTKNLARIVLYSASSISSPDWGLAFSDENTFSSTNQTKSKFSPIVFSQDSKVLALSDLTFLAQPYNLNWDNNQFMINLVDWLTKPERIFHLSDFPYFFQKEVEINYALADYLDSAVKLKNFLQNLGKNSQLSLSEKTPARDSIFLGLFADGGKVGDFLKSGKITIGGTKITIEGFGLIDKEKTSILYLQKTPERELLIILSDTKENLEKTVDGIINGQFRDWLISDNLAIHHLKE